MIRVDIKGSHGETLVCDACHEPFPLLPDRKLVEARVPAGQTWTMLPAMTIAHLKPGESLTVLLTNEGPEDECISRVDVSVAGPRPDLAGGRRRP